MKAGYAEADITPTDPCPLLGYPFEARAPDQPCPGARRRLSAMPFTFDMSMEKLGVYQGIVPSEPETMRGTNS